MEELVIKVNETRLNTVTKNNIAFDDRSIKSYKMSKSQKPAYEYLKNSIIDISKKVFSSTSLTFTSICEFYSQPSHISQFFELISNVKMPEYDLCFTEYQKQIFMEKLLRNQYIDNALSIVTSRCKEFIDSAKLSSGLEVSIIQLLSALISYTKHAELEEDVFAMLDEYEVSKKIPKSVKIYVTCKENAKAAYLSNESYLEFSKEYTDDYDNLISSLNAYIKTKLDAIGIDYDNFDIKKDLHSGELAIMLLSYKLCVFVPFGYYNRDIDLNDEKSVIENRKLVEKNWSLALHMLRSLDSNSGHITILNVNVLARNVERSILCFGFMYQKIPEYQDQKLKSLENIDMNGNYVDRSEINRKYNQEHLEIESLKERSENIKIDSDLIRSSSIIEEDEENNNANDKISDNDDDDDYSDDDDDYSDDDDDDNEKEEEEEDIDE